MTPTPQERRIAHELYEARKRFPHNEVTDAQLQGYVEDLTDLPIEAVVQAIIECRRTEPHFPALSRIRNRVVEISGDGVLVDPEAAWGEVRREARRVGYNRPRIYHKGEFIDPPGPEFSSPMIAAAVEAIGWRDICLTEDDDLPIVRAQFRDALRAIQRRGVDRVASGRQPAGPMLDTGNGRGDLAQIGAGSDER